MPLAGAPRDLYTQLLACTSLQSVVAIACCLRASLCFGFACLLFLLVQGLLIEPTIVWLLVWMGRTPHQDTLLQAESSGPSSLAPAANSAHLQQFPLQLLLLVSTIPL